MPSGPGRAEQRTERDATFVEYYNEKGIEYMSYLFLRPICVFALVCAACLGAAPSHVPTSDYWAGYAGTKAVPADVSARWLTWAESDIPGSKQLHAHGVKVIIYSDPNRQIEGRDLLWNDDEATFMHDCSGNRIEARRSGQYLMDPHSTHLRQLWKRAIDRRWNAGQFDAVLNDDANDLLYLRGNPCNVNPDDWLRATNDSQRSLGHPVIYNGLLITQPGIPQSIGLNQTALGGMMEQCYAGSPRDPKQGGWKWSSAENTELRMAHEGKIFICYNNDTSPADQSLDGRMYVFASYLLTYDPRTTVLWEYYGTPTRAHVMPEVQFVPFDPVKPDVRTIDDLRTSSGVYAREYHNCYFSGSRAGKCIVVVNPDDSDHSIQLRGYTKVLAISGSGIFDGGKAQIVSQSMPQSLPARSAVIAIR
jgi:Hypothetical glycosyl hydrolase family 15